MKFFTSAILSSAVFTAFVSAQIISITSPLSGTRLKAGSDAIISWVNPKVQTIPQIVLARGPSTALQPVMVIAKNVNAAEGRYVWSIPYEIQNGEEYAFEFGQSPDLAFAGPFIIEGGTGGTAPSSKTDDKTAAGAQPAPQSPPPASANPPPSTPASTTPNNSGSSANPAGGAASPAGSHSVTHSSGATHLSYITESTLAIVGLGAVVAVMQLL